MQGFEDVKVSWKGADYTIRATAMMPLVAKMEDILSGDSGKPAVQVLTTGNGPSVPRLSMAYAAALRHAGASVSDDEVYLSIINDFAQGNADVATKIQMAIHALLAIMAPPIAIAMAADFDDDEKKNQAAES